MAYQNTEFKLRPDSGGLHASNFKKFKDSPDYFGEIAINFKDMTNIKTEDGLTIIKLGGWKKVAKSGKTYLSLSVSRFVPEQQVDTNQPRRQEVIQEDFGDEDLPF